MRILFYCALIVGLASAVGLSDQVRAAGEPDARPVGRAADHQDVPDRLADPPHDAADVKLTLVPSNFNLNRSISFDEAGEPRHRQDQLSINFRCFYETQATPLAYRDLEIISAITSAGEELEVDPNRQRRQVQNIRPDRQRNGKPYFDLYFNLPAPTRHAQTIRELRGHIQMDLSRGPERVLRLSPVSDYVGKRFSVTDMDDSPMSMRWIEADNNQPAMLEWTHARSIESLVQEVKFYRRNGVEFEAVQRGGGSDTTTRNLRFAVDAIEDVVMVVRLFRETRTVEVPFVVHDLPLPVADPAGPRFDLAIATQAIGAAGIEVVPGKDLVDGLQPGENDLPIIILD